MPTLYLFYRVFADKEVSRVARRLYGSHTPWKGFESKSEDEATRLRYVRTYNSGETFFVN